MKILIAPDKFKGTLSAEQAATALRNGWLRARPDDAVRCIPISDGGEGFAEVCGAACGAVVESVRVEGPLGAPVDAIYYRGRKEVFLETSAACGLALVPKLLRNPARTTTRGVGEILRHLATIASGPVLAGLGGSGTNDGGFGMAVALGYRFLDAGGRDLPLRPQELRRLERIVPPLGRCWPEVVAAVDVSNPMLGGEGCARRFGFQKGMLESDVSAFEDALARLADVAERDLGKRAVAALSGSGAAGGLGFGLRVFCDAEVVPGFDLVSELLGLPTLVSEADVVLTGEGALDFQSLSGKAPVALSRLAASFGKPVLCAAGVIDRTMDWKPHFADMVSLAECSGSREVALADPTAWLEEGAFRLALGVIASNRP